MAMPSLDDGTITGASTVRCSTRESAELHHRNKPRCPHALLMLHVVLCAARLLLTLLGSMIPTKKYQSAIYI